MEPYHFVKTLLRPFQNDLLFPFVLLTPLVFSSCMHLIMGNQHQGTMSHSEVAQEKEVLTGKYKLTASFPPLRNGEETGVTLLIVNSESGTPYSKADVIFDVQLADSSVDHSMMPMEHSSDTSDMTQMSAKKEFQKQMSQGTDQGLFRFSYSAGRAGEYVLTLSVNAIDGVHLEKPIFIHTTRKVIQHETPDGMGMMGPASIISIMVVAVMATMMLLTWMK